MALECMHMGREWDEGQDRESTQIEEGKDVSTKIHPFGADLAV